MENKGRKAEEGGDNCTILRKKLSTSTGCSQIRRNRANLTGEKKTVPKVRRI